MPPLFIYVHCSCKDIFSMCLSQMCFFFFLVVTGKVTSVTPGPRGSAEVDVYIIKVHKKGQLKTTKRGPLMTVTITASCIKCPALRKGTQCSYNKQHLAAQILELFFSSSTSFM